MFPSREVEKHHGIFRPFPFHIFYLESSEEFFICLEITFECRHEERLAESPRTAQEEVFAAGMRHAVYIPRLVYIQEIFLSNPFESLYANRI